MCGTCGCGEQSTVSTEGTHQHVLADGTVVTHTHGPHSHDPGEHRGHEPHGEHDHHHDEHEHHLAGGRVIRHRHDELPPAELRRVTVEQDVLARNDRTAQRNRARFAHDRTFAVNLMSSPGSGKTTLLVKTLEALGSSGRSLMVIEGDQRTSLDADRIRATGVPAVQINTGKGCHLDAEMVQRALDARPLPTGGLLFIENVGNLVCPAGFDLGEAKKVVIASVTEGEEKPLKYPDMFAVADVVVVNKVDLVGVLGFDLEALERNVRRVNPKARILRVSARTGEGFADWLAWLSSENPAP